MLTGVWADRGEQLHLDFAEQPQHISVHALRAALVPVLVTSSLELVESALDGFPKQHDFVGLHCLLEPEANRAQKHLVRKRVVPCPGRGGSVKNLVHPVHLPGQAQNCCVGSVVDKVGIVDAIAGVCQSEAHGICGILENGFTQSLEVSRGLGHLIVVQEKVTVAPHALGPLLFWEDGRVVVEAEGEMVLDQVFSRDTEVEGVPIVELRLHLVKRFLGDVGLWQVAINEDVVPHLRGHVLRSNSALVGSVHLSLLEDVGDCVVGHVDRGIRQGLDKVLLIPRH
mmetsp:Transcript_289/g.712  ORF Transcript_289/g.712 Transcript_289/m.712 type:complete len:283 (-) Transcript_289:491-1339(-)